MKRALITGGAGFIAHHLISQILKSTDWEVVTLDRLDFSGNLNRLQDVLKDFSAEEILSTVDPKTMLKKEPSYEYRDLPEDGIEKNEYHIMHSLDEFPNT